MFITKLRHQRGFTLIELAIVLMIVGVLAGSFLSTLSSRIDATRRAEAAKEMEVIKQALYGYAMSQGATPHLPCPDCRNVLCASAGNFPNDGKEDRSTPATCDVGNFPGNLPWVTLGTGFGDPWANRYSYWVSSDLVDEATGFTLGTAITAATVNTRLGADTPQVSNNAVAIIMSQGKNGYGIISTQNDMNAAVPAANLDEKENLDGNETAPVGPPLFYSRPPTEATASTAGGEFDDMLLWISEYELKAKMVEAGVLP